MKKCNVTVPCRYRSITKQFFRKADGVVVIYDITMEDSFRSVRPWLTSIQEAVGDPIPVMLLGNKSDQENEREVQTKEADMLAEVCSCAFSLTHSISYRIYIICFAFTSLHHYIQHIMHRFLFYLVGNKPDVLRVQCLYWS